MEGLENCMAIANDIIIYVLKEDGSDHDRTVRKVLDKANSVGMKLKFMALKNMVVTMIGQLEKCWIKQILLA